jgi:lipopolysaccharide assembly outer membrane protein LptD (OstA)
MAFNFAADTEFVTLNVSVATVSASGQIELIKQPDPFILHGDPAWLSVDLRVFTVRAGETRFGRTMGSSGSAAP